MMLLKKFQPTCELIKNHVSPTAKASIETEAHKRPAICTACRVNLLLLLLTSITAAVHLLLLLLQLLAARHNPVVCCQDRSLQLAVHVALSKGVEGRGVHLVRLVALQKASMATAAVQPASVLGDWLLESACTGGGCANLPIMLSRAHLPRSQQAANPATTKTPGLCLTPPPAKLNH
jgi:hypothetical protein